MQITIYKISLLSSDYNLQITKKNP